MEFVDRDALYGIKGYKRITMDELDDNGMIALIGAVIKTAAEDYRKAILRENNARMKECERFFLGKYFHSLTNLDGQAMIEKIRRDTRREIAEGVKVKKDERKSHRSKGIRRRFALDDR